MSDDTKITTSIPAWNGDKDKFNIWFEQFQAVVNVKGDGDALDAVAMRTLPTHAEYAALDLTNADDKAKADLYKLNKKVVSLLVLAIKSNSAMAVIKSMKSSDYPDGKAYEIMDKLRGKNMPKDASAVIELDAELEKIPFRNAEQYNDDVTSVLAEYDVTKTQTELITIMAKKLNSSTYGKILLDHLKDTSCPDSLETVCNDINDVQRIVKAKGATSKSEKEVSLAAGDEEDDGCGYCGRKNHKEANCQFKKKDSEAAKAAAKGNSDTTSNRGRPKCNACGGRHKEEKCWKLHPELAPESWRKKNEVATSSVETEETEVMLSNLDQDFCLACQL